MKNETAKREIESLDYYLQNHTDDYSEESHTAMMMAVKALEQEPISVIEQIKSEIKNYLEDEKYSDDGISDVGVGLQLALNIIDRVVKEYTE